MNKKYFLEEFGIATILTICIIMSVIYYVQHSLNMNNSLTNFVENILPSFLDANEGTLVSLAAILIGIYFTIFTLLGTVKLESTVSLLSEINFLKLVKYIRNAFVVTFIYVIVLLIIPNAEKHNLPSYIYIINFLLLLYVLLSAFRFAILMYNSFKYDIKNFEKLKQEEIAHREEKRALRIRLTNFLSNAENEQNLKRYKSLDEQQKKLQQKE